MADKTLKSLTFPGLSDKYVIPDLEVDDTLTQQGKAADAKAVGDALTALESDISTMSEDIANKADIITDTATGAIASFPDGSDGLPLKSLVASIEPVQDLHGQDSPYPPGGGVNKIDVVNRTLSTTPSPSTYKIEQCTATKEGGTYTSIANGAWSKIQFGVTGTLKENQTYTLSVLFSNPNNTNVGLAYYSDTWHGIVLSSDTNVRLNMTFVYTSDIDRIAILTNNKLTSNGDVVTVSEIQLEEGSEVSTYAPYSNICPISGWTGMNGQRTGVNLFDKANGAKNLYVGAGDKTGTGGTLLCFLAKKGCQYTINMTGGNRTNLYYYDASSLDDIVSGITLTQVTLSASKPYTFIASRDAVYCYYADANYQQSIADSCQVVVGTSAEDYEAYSAESLSVSWQDTAGTVYGGTMTVNEDGSGELTVDKADVDLGTLTWTYTTGDSYAGSPYFASDNVGDKKPGSNNMICSQYAIGANRGNIQNCVIAPWNETNAKSLACRDDRFTDAASFKTAVTGQTLCYELATPLTYHFDNLEQLSTVYGINNIWVDTGDVQCEYRADTKLYLEKLTAPTEDDMIANANIAANKFFMVGNNLYLSTAAIAQGASIVPGTNCTLTNLADALNTLNT